MRTAALCVSVVVMSGCLKTEDPPPLTGPGTQHPLLATQKPFDFTLPRYPDKSAFKLASERGNVVLLDVWATWCEPCRDSLPLYQDLAKEYGNRGFKFYAINVDTDPSQIPKFLSESKLSLNVLLDPDAQFAEKELKVKVMPTALFIDRSGHVRSVHEGFSEDTLQQYLTEIEALLKEPAPQK